MDPERNNFLKIFNSIDFNQINDHPNILVAARFWEEDRYCAAKTCYKFMRAIDDMIDNHKAQKSMIDPGKKREFRSQVEEWLKMVISSEECKPVQKEISDTFKSFRIPLWTIEDFAESMIYDINHNGFTTLNDFLIYARGASVAPASIFVHLAGLRKTGNAYSDPPFDVREAATPCAIFSYLVHIIRDFQKDQLNNLNYFADDLLIENNLTRSNLKQFANGTPANSNFRNLIREYLALADEYRRKTVMVLNQIKSMVGPRYRLSLEIIFNLYILAFEKIKPEKGIFTTEELKPTPEETRESVLSTIMNFKAD